MSERGVVVKEEKGFTEIKLYSFGENFCSSCSIQRFCFQGKNERILRIRNKWNLKVGEEVEIDIKESHNILIAFLVFILPLILFISLYILLIRFSTTIAILGSGSSIVCYFFVLEIFQSSLLSNIKVSKANKDS